MNHILTVFTPTYNRAYTLHKCYESLIKQTCKQFTWLIVDDGSSDNTEDIVEEWLAKGEISIQYYKKPNGGKSSAHNMAVELATTELFLCVDSDDYLTIDAIEKVIRFWDKNMDSKAAGIVALKGYEKGKPVGTYMPRGIIRSTLYDLYNKHGFKGDAMLIYRTEVLKKYPFPIIEGEKFIPEAYVYDQIDSCYDLLLLNEVLYICEYLEDGYTRNFKEVVIKNPKGYAMFYAQRMTLCHSFYMKYRGATLFVLGNLLSGNLRCVKSAPLKVMTLLAFPAGFLIYVVKYRCGRLKNRFTTKVV